MAASDLPEEIWRRILAFCKRERQGDGFTPEETLAALMRVSSTVQAIAAPILYEDVQLHDLNSFFLGAQPPSLFLPPSKTGTHRPRPIHKNVLLGYVHDPHNRQDSDTNGTITVTYLQAYRDAELSLLRYIESLAEPTHHPPYLLSLPRFDTLPLLPADTTTVTDTTLFLKLGRVRIYRGDPQSPSLRSNRIASILRPLVRLSRPEQWCGDHRLAAEVRQAGMVLDQRAQSLITLHTHTQSLGLVVICLGVRNILYIEDPPGCAQWDQHSFDDVYTDLEKLCGLPPLGYPTIHQKIDSGSRVLGPTSIVIYGLLPDHLDDDILEPMTRPTLFRTDTDSDQLVAMQAEHMEESRGRALEMRDRLQQRLRSWMTTDKDVCKRLDPMKVELRMAWEAEPCPCCGKTCDS